MECGRIRIFFTTEKGFKAIGGRVSCAAHGTGLALTLS
jgi:hypothetical protein